MPHPTDCTKYKLCNNGEYLVLSCAAGLSWDSEMNHCDYSANVNCNNNKAVSFDMQSANILPYALVMY